MIYTSLNNTLYIFKNLKQNTFSHITLANTKTQFAEAARIFTQTVIVAAHRAELTE